MTLLDLPGRVLKEAQFELGLNLSQTAELGDISRRTLTNIHADKARTSTKASFIKELRENGYDLQATKTVQNYNLRNSKGTVLPLGNLASVPYDNGNIPPIDPTEDAMAAWTCAEESLKATTDALHEVVELAFSEKGREKLKDKSMRKLMLHLDILSKQLDEIKEAQT